MAGRTVRNRRNSSRAVRAAAAAACATLVLGACGSTKDTVASGDGAGDGTGKVGVILPLLTSPFWQSYNDYVPKMAESEGVNALKTVNSNSDPSQQITDINNQLNQGVKGIVVAPWTAPRSPRASTRPSARASPWSPSTWRPRRARSPWSYAPTTWRTARRPATT